MITLATLLLAVLVVAVAPQDAVEAGPLPDRGDRQISMYIREVFQDRAGNYWLGTNGDGVVRYDGDELVYFGASEGFGGAAVRGIAEDPATGAVWFGTDAGVTRCLDGAFTNYTAWHGLPTSDVWSILFDTRGVLWVGTGDGAYRLEGESFEAFPLPVVVPRVARDNGSARRGDPRFSDQLVWCMHEDRHGHVWFGTNGQGAHRWDGNAIASFTHAMGLASDSIRCITSDRNGHVWLGTDGSGVTRFNGALFETLTTADGLSNDRIFEVYEDRAGDLWFSTLGAGACRYAGETFTTYPPDEGLRIFDRPARGHVQEFFQDSGGVMWLGCSGGLFRFDAEASTFVNVTKDGGWPAEDDPS